MEDIRNAKHWVATPPPENTLIYVLDVKDSQGWQVSFRKKSQTNLPRTCTGSLNPTKTISKPTEFYWILSILGYGQVVFYGNTGDAEELQELWCRREGRVIPLRKADKDNPLDKSRVQKEIANVIEDIRAGINGLTPLPAEGWV